MLREIRAYLAWRGVLANWTAYRKDHPMLTLSQVLKSRTFWTLAATAVFNGWNSIAGGVQDPYIVAAVNGALSILAMAFRIAPNQHVDTSK